MAVLHAGLKALQPFGADSNLSDAFNKTESSLGAVRSHCWLLRQLFDRTFTELSERARLLEHWLTSADRAVAEDTATAVECNAVNRTRQIHPARRHAGRRQWGLGHPHLAPLLPLCLAVCCAFASCMEFDEFRDAHAIFFPQGASYILCFGVIPVLSVPVWMVLGTPAAASFAATLALYYGSYEWMHLSYHAPPDSLLGRMPGVAYLRRHHQIHHNQALMVSIRGREGRARL